MPRRILAGLVLTTLYFQSTYAADMGAMNSVEKIENGPLTMEVFTSTPNGYSVTSTLIYGDRDLILIDPQFLLPEAEQVVDLIKATGKRLTTIYTTHAHPDHFLGVPAILAAFPNARYVALPEVRERMITGWPSRRNFWVQTYGEDVLPGEEPVLPEPLLDPPMLSLEGYNMPITRDQIGLDGAGNSFVHIPVINTVVTGDIIFNSHLRPPADTAPLYETLDRITALDPDYVVAGHQAKGATSEADVLNFVREYIGAFKMARMLSATPAELEVKMLQMYPGLGRQDALTQAATRAFE